MLEMLLNSNPNLYNQCIDVLQNAVRSSEVRYNATPKTFGFRPLRSNDVGFDSKSWSGVFPAHLQSYIAEATSALTIPTSNAWVYFGWITDKDFGINSEFIFLREGVIKSKISSTFVYNCENPAHMFIDIQNITTIKENERVSFEVHNHNGHDIVANVIPIIYRIASQAALNLYDSSFVKVSDKVQIPKRTSNLKGIREKLSDMLSIEQLKGIIHEINNPTPTDFVKIKDENDREHDELRAKLDPSYRLWLENLKDNKVCQFCGSTIERVYSSKYCHYCGVKIKWLKK